VCVVFGCCCEWCCAEDSPCSGVLIILFLWVIFVSFMYVCEPFFSYVNQLQELYTAGGEAPKDGEKW
jgi:hypothetical protein